MRLETGLAVSRAWDGRGEGEFMNKARTMFAGAMLASIATFGPQTHIVSSASSHGRAQPAGCAAAVAAGFARCFAQLIAQATTAPSGLNPADLQSAYQLSSSTNGLGQAVAIVDAYNE